ncbi:PC-Esterase domain-containing protein/PMR5N domain-containing protein [Cephalotus follicularis]|uniref:PC-Esterase domain-containing protein/PMR5N domain-containing protein n=1 Tax=Cephalotus follicularis TaxID=3775 RepID=A0A1Q3BI98_CEPFO|nr:PC-Esterase domain-containing protein/PMR5N domain-containing protein [Cephalotus follicularis]
MAETVSRFNLSSLGNLRPIYTRILSFNNMTIKGHCKSWFFQSWNGLVALGPLLLFFVAVACASYMYMFPGFQPIYYSSGIPKSSDPFSKCNVFEGSWIRDKSYPLYNASECPFAEGGFDCLANGRRDNDYLKWRWKPRNCDIPRYDAHAILENLRGKRVIFVGDSMSRTQWESLICMLMTGVEDKKSVYEVNGNKITKRIRFLGVQFSSFKLRIDFYRSVFLVQTGPVPRRAPKRVKSSIILDKLDDISKEWIDSDYLIFNSGHWWSQSKLFEVGCYFQVGRSLKLGMSINSAFRTALGTWASWAETSINTNRTRIFFRTFESSHWSGRNRNSCKVTQLLSSKTKGRDHSPISDIIIKPLVSTWSPRHVERNSPRIYTFKRVRYS